MLAQMLRITLFILFFTHLGEAARPPAAYYNNGMESDSSDSTEHAPNVAEFELTFGIECNMPSLEELELMLRRHFELGVSLYDADIEEEIDVVVNAHESSKISQVVSYLQKEEGFSCEISISEPTFVTSELLPDSNEFLAYMYESGFMEDVSHMEETDEERRKLAERASSYPESLDFRAYIPRVKDQGQFSPDGVDVGSCAAHAASTIKEIHERMDYGLKEELSPRFVYAHRNTGMELGMYTHRVFTILRDEGIPLEKDYPITSYETSGMFDTPSTIPADVKRKAKMHRVSSLTKFTSNWYTADSYVKSRLIQLINEKGAGLINVHAWEKDWDKKGEDCKLYKKEGNQKYVDAHMMAVVGYDKDGLIIRNSWSTMFCDNGDMHMSWRDVNKYAIEINFWEDTPTRSCRNFEDVTGVTCWSLGHRALNPLGWCNGKECSLVDAPGCCVHRRKTCLNKNSCCLWGTTCYGCPDNGNSQSEWVWNCGSSRRCNGRGSKNECLKSPGDCCFYGSTCHGCPWGNEWVSPGVCGTSRRCKLY